MKKENTQDIPWDDTLPLLPLRDIVLFPGMIAPLFVGREKSILALDKCFEDKKFLMLSAQKDPATNDPQPEEIHEVGCVAEVTQILRLPEGTVKAIVEGRSRARIKKLDTSGRYLVAKVERLEPDHTEDAEVKALIRAVKTSFERYVKLSSQIPNETINTLAGIDKAGDLADLIAASVIASSEEKQKILEAVTLQERLESLAKLMQKEIEILQIERRVRNRVKKQMEKSQKDYYLTEQMRAIQKELGKDTGGRTEFEELREKIKASVMSKEAEEKALKELSRLEQMPPMSAEGTVSRNYIDWLTDVPWSKRTRDKLDIKAAEKILNTDHYGLDKVKERILEYLAVRKLVNKMKGPILCFVGPPGVGKTSLGKSIARAMGRKFSRFSLGGVRDEAEIRGHRRTYIGSFPGRIVQSMKKTGVKNPVIMLDEIDKISSDFRGDPASALLEALDPEQNYAFNDHYMEVDYDLSEVMFITTANLLHTIPRPLLDRMEVIQISGYIDIEKQNIARRFLLPKQEKQHGLPAGNIDITDSALLKIIRNYTREAGVRNLERELAKLCRKKARKIAETSGVKKGVKVKKSHVDENRLAELLGEIKFRDDQTGKKDEIGIATGLAWTETGGVTLRIETSVFTGKGKFMLTGKLGEVMRESAQAALSYLRSKTGEFALPKGFHSNTDIHIHIPEGAIPKDGPSAGITLAVAMASAFLKIPVRRDVAMTGEITLRGDVLPIGGLKEKLLAALRAGIKIVLIPEENARDLKEVPANILESLKVEIVRNMDEVLLHALAKPPAKRKKARSVSNKPAVKKGDPGRTPRPALN